MIYELHLIMDSASRCTAEISVSPSPILLSIVHVLMRLLSRFSSFLLRQSLMLRWMICTVHEDEMFLLNDALQPFQVLQGQADHNIPWFHYANRPLLLHSRQCVYECVCICVTPHHCAALSSTSPPFRSLPL